MANTFTLINSTTLASDQSTIVFSSIPQTYTDLVLKASLQVNKASPTVFRYMYYVLNGDTTNTWYSDTYLLGDGASTASGRDSSATAANTAETPVNATGGGANVFTNFELYLPNYTSTTSKPFTQNTAMERNVTSGAYNMQQALLYRNTTAITSIGLYISTADNWITGSTAYLYGIKSS